MPGLSAPLICGARPGGGDFSVAFAAVLGHETGTVVSPQGWRRTCFVAEPALMWDFVVPNGVIR
jgi:hypothetical protein